MVTHLSTKIGQMRSSVSETEFLRLIKSSLGAHPTSVLSSLPAEAHANADQLLGYLRKRYHPIANPEVAYAKLADAQQGYHSLSDYHRLFSTIFNEIPDSDKAGAMNMARHKYICGLANKDLCFHLLKKIARDLTITIE